MEISNMKELIDQGIKYVEYLNKRIKELEDSKERCCIEGFEFYEEHLLHFEEKIICHKKMLEYEKTDTENLILMKAIARSKGFRTIKIDGIDYEIS